MFAKGHTGILWHGTCLPIDYTNVYHILVWNNGVCFSRAGSGKACGRLRAAPLTRASFGLPWSRVRVIGTVGYCPRWIVQVTCNTTIKYHHCDAA
jgi:hypothetical protein